MLRLARAAIAYMAMALVAHERRRRAASDGLTLPMYFDFAQDPDWLVMTREADIHQRAPRTRRQFPSGRQFARSARAAVAQSINEQSDHAPSVVRPAIVRSLAQTYDRIQQLRSSEIGSDGANDRRGLKECPKCRPESLLEVGGQGIEGRVARVQGGGQPAFGSNEGRVALHPLRQRLAGLVLGRQDRRRRRRRRRCRDERRPRRGRRAAESGDRRCRCRRRPSRRSLAPERPLPRSRTPRWPPGATHRCCAARRRARADPCAREAPSHRLDLPVCRSPRPA